MEKDDFIGAYYVRLKDVYINWTHRTSKRFGKEAYIPIPAKYAYVYGIRKGSIFRCKYLESGEVVELRASGSQSRRDYAKQFQGNNNLKLLHEWFVKNSAKPGDFVLVNIFANEYIELEFISQNQDERVEELNLIGDKGNPSEAMNIESDDPNLEHCGFRLYSLLIKKEGHEVCNINFLHEEYRFSNLEPMTSLIIGANGTGKSFALQVISDIFLTVQNGRVRKSPAYDYCKFQYVLDGHLVVLEIENNTVLIHYDGCLIEELSTNVLPKSVLSIAFMLNDKFAFSNAEDDKCSIYKYLGLRTASNAAWINTINSKTVENIIELAVDDKLWDLLENVSNYLEIDPRMDITFELNLTESQYKSVIALDKEKIVQLLSRQGRLATQKVDFKSGVVERLEEEDYHKLADYLIELIKNDTHDRLFTISFSNETTSSKMEEIRSTYDKLVKLSRLRILRNNQLYLYKNGNRYSFSESSSGEKNIIYTVLNVARYLKDESLVLIDEPEISLHPNWQMLYISFLKKIFKNFSSCHFLIATHSPYLVSDLNPESSSVVVLSIEDGQRVAKTLDYSTYAWSTENILYNVFHVRTTRNFYFDMDLRKLAQLISTNNIENISAIKEIYHKLNSFIIDENDPLQLILAQARRYIENAES